MTFNSRYKRILLKLSGELLKGTQDFGFDEVVITQLCEQIKEVNIAGVEVAIVVGGGNIFRGEAPFAAEMDRPTADTIGMLATLLNALILQECMERMGLEVRVLSPLPSPNVAEPFIRREADKYLKEGQIVVLACGTGSPFFTTDTAAALRANELKCDVLLKGTRVLGVYSDDPETTPDARFYDRISYNQVLREQLKVMDATAFALCRDNDMPVIIFDMTKQGNLKGVISGEKVGTLVSEKGD